MKKIKTSPKPTTNARSKQREPKVLTEEELRQVTGGSGGWECPYLGHC
jgi:bacteriocin-like protein